MESKRLWNSGFIVLILISFISASSFNMVYIIISKYSKTMSSSLGMVGVLTGIFSIAALMARPLAGFLSDAYNKKSLFIGANALIGFSIIGYGISQTLTSLFFFRVLHGAAFGLGSTINIALVTSYIPPKRLGEGLGYYGLGQVMAQILSPNLGLMFLNRFGFNLFFLFVGSISILGLVLVLPLRSPSLEGYKTKPSAFGSLHAFVAKEVLIYAALGGVFSLCNGIVSSFIVLLSEERMISHIGLFFSVGAAVLFVLRLFIGRMVDKKGLYLVVNTAFFLLAMAMVLIGLGQGLVIMLIASVLKAMGQGSGQISLQTACIRGVDPSRVGVATSTFYIGADIGQGLGPMIGGYIAGRLGYGNLFLYCGVVVFVVLVVFYFYQINKEKAYEKSF